MADRKADRASQFIPFDALKGFREALRRKEEEVEAKNDMMYMHVKSDKSDIRCRNL